MKKFPGLVCLLCLLLTSSFGVDRNAFTFTRSELDLHIDPARQLLEASGKIALRNDSSSAQRIAVLQVSSSLDWKSITAAGKPVQYETHEYTSDMDHTGALDEALVTLPQAVPPKGTVELEVAYSGTVARDHTRLARIGTPAEIAARTDWDRISPDFTALRGIGYVVWYPISTEAASLSEGNAVFEAIAAWNEREQGTTVRAHIMLPKGSMQTLVSNGVTEGSTSPTAVVILSSEAQFTFEQGSLAPVFVIANLHTLREPASGKAKPAPANVATVLFLPGHDSGAKQYAEVAQQVQPLITRWFGPPTGTIGIVDLPGGDWVPYESGRLLLTPLSTANPQQVELTLAHQLTHASFYSSRLWMQEGLAHFAQALEREQQENAAAKPQSSPPEMTAGRKAAIAYMDQQLPPLVAAERSQLPEAPNPLVEHPQASQGQPLITTRDELFYRTKAMFVWWMLRDMVGDQALQRAIQSYRAADDKEPSYFQRLLGTQEHRDLEWFFDDWVYRDRGLAEFHISSVHPRALLPSEYSVTVTVDNSGGAGAEVLVLVRAVHGAVDRRIEVHAREKAVVRMPVPEAPVEAIVNDGSIPEYSFQNNKAEIKASSGRE